LSGDQGSILSGGSAWTIGAKNTDATFSGTISSGSTTKVGTGKWTVDGTNTYTGTTTVSAGTLLVNGDNSAATGNVTVNSSGTLGGSGSIGGATTVSGKLSLADSAIGTLTFTNSLTLASGSTTTLEVSRTAGTSDLVDGNATVTYGGTLVVTNLSGTFALNDSYKIFDAAAYAGTFTGFNLPSLNAGLAWSTTNLTVSGTISVVSSGVLPPVPDAPTNLVAVAVGYTQINLTWADTSTNEVSFFVESSTDGGNFTEIASVAAGVTNYSDTGLSSGMTRYYRVRAGNTGGYSPYSNIASTATFTSLIWRGDGSANAWNIGVTANWRSNNVASLFANGAAVVFDDTGSNNTSVSLSSAVSPYSVSVTAAKNYTFAGAGQLAGSGALMKSGAGSLSIGSSNTYSGGTVISGGAVVLTSDNGNTYGLGTGSVTISNATLTMYDNYATYDSLPWNLVVPDGAVATLNADSRCDLNGTLTGGGTLNLRIPNNRTEIYGDWSAFSGVVNVLPSGSGGKEFRIAASYSWPGLPGAALNLGTNINVNWQGNLNSGSSSVFDIGELSGASSASVSGGTIVGRSLNYRVGWLNTDAVFAGRINDQTTGSPTLITKVGGGKWILSGTNTYSGITTVSTGTLQFGDGGTAGTLPTNGIVNNATLAFNRADNLAYAGIISGTGSVVQDGDGVVSLSNNHTYSGATVISSGTLALSGSGSISNSSIALADGAMLDVSARTGGSMTLASGK
ncbi:MAG: autotransporter-associated beta strand repeat-containing protein, partial [Verrucomicrobia bacterium]|nr:autotransporter-associated beta strand repeat-containing protein [Verrucomicrobiota bacterium]